MAGSHGQELRNSDDGVLLPRYCMGRAARALEAVDSFKESIPSVFSL